MHCKSLSRFFISTLLALPIASVGVNSALSQGANLEFAITNNTPRSIVDFRVDPSSESNWGPNILNKDIGPGEVLGVIIQDGLTTCVYDTYTRWSDDSEVIEKQVDMCENPSWTYTE